MNPALRFAAPLVLASLVLGLSACKQETTEEAAPEATEETAAAAEPGAPIIPGIEGLATDRDQVSYMIGLDIGNSMKVIKDDLDLDMVRQAMEDAFGLELPQVPGRSLGQGGGQLRQPHQAGRPGAGGAHRSAARRSAAGRGMNGRAGRPGRRDGRRCRGGGATRQ